MLPIVGYSAANVAESHFTEGGSFTKLGLPDSVYLLINTWILLEKWIKLLKNPLWCKNTKLVWTQPWSNGCWECIFRFIINDGMDENNNRRNLSSLSTVSKRFLSITGRLRFSLTLVNPTPPFLLSLFKRFTHLNFLDLSRYLGNNLDDLLCQISDFPSFKIISLKLPNVGNRFPANGLRAFSQNITTLTSFTCSGFVNLFLIAECFPLLDDLDLRLKYPLNYISMIETRTRSYNIG